MQNVRTLKQCLALISAASLLYVIGCSPSTPGGKTSLTSFRKGDLAQLQVPGQPNANNPKVAELDTGVQPPAAPPPDMAFTGPDGKLVKIADFKGKVTLVNIWATTCAPCKVEMPTLAALAKDYAGKNLAVVAVSTDVAEDTSKAATQIAANAPLAFYHSNGIDLAFAFKPETTSMPTTIIYDKAGVEAARLSGPADWNGPNARALIDTLLAG